MRSSWKMGSMLVTTLLGLGLGPTSAFSFVSGEILAGKRWYESDQKGRYEKFGSTDVTAAVLLDPIPLVPVAAGLSVSTLNFNADDLKLGEVAPSESSNVSVGIDAKAWLPLVPFVTPYAKVRVPVYSKMLLEYESQVLGNTAKASEEFKVTGTYLGIGAEVPVLPLPLLDLAVLVEYGYTSETAKWEKSTLDGFGSVSAEDGSNSKSDIDLTSQVFLVGVKAGI